MLSKCFRYNCNFVQDVAHMDEALDVLRQHFRAVHPTKGFFQNREIESLESYNLTADEIFEQNNVGPREGEPQYDWRLLRSQVTRWERDDARYINPDTVAEVTRRVEEHFAANPEQEAPPAVALNARLWGDVAPVPAVPPFDGVVEELEIAPDAGF